MSMVKELSKNATIRDNVTNINNEQNDEVKQPKTLTSKSIM